MSRSDPFEYSAAIVEQESAEVDPVRSLLEKRPVKATNGALEAGVVVGTLVAIESDGGIPLVLYSGRRDRAAVRARSVVDLHAAHIGKEVVLMFEGGDFARPIVMGVLRGAFGWPLDDRPAQVEVDADGERLVVSAKDQLVLRCGEASITLTRAGKVLIRGNYVSTRSAGVHRIKGGSVQIN
jgi:hypothetical protein